MATRNKPKLIGLADCNNFFVSCERSIRPELNGRPVVVLSNNDGCIVSRSNEAKAMQIPMGAPLFKWQGFFEKNGVTVISGNHELYGGISRRVMAVLAEYTDTVEQYSIDEAFFNLAIASIDDHAGYCEEIRRAVLEKCGIPVSIGISTSKTLCKLGSEMAKARCMKDASASPVCVLRAEDAYPLYPRLSPADVWGVGRRTAQALRAIGITTVADMLSMDERTIRRMASIRLVQTVRELRGIPEFPLCGEEEKQKSMMVSSSFGKRLTDYSDIKVALIKHAYDGARKLRSAGLKARVVGVTLRTSRFISAVYANSAKVEMDPPASQDGEIIAAALRCLEEIYRPGIEYAKTGIFFDGLEDGDCRQLTMFDLDPQREKKERQMKSIDELNAKFGKRTIFPAVIKDTSAVDPQHRWRSAVPTDAQAPADEA